MRVRKPSLWRTGFNIPGGAQSLPIPLHTQLMSEVLEPDIVCALMDGRQVGFFAKVK